MTTRPRQPLHSWRPATPPRRQQGLSLIELMVAMTIGLFVLMGIAVAYTTAKSAFGYASNTVHMAEDAAFGLDMISRDLRMAGYAGCAGTSVTSNGATPPAYTYTPSLTLLAGQTLAANPNPFFGVTGAPTALQNVYADDFAVYGFDANNGTVNNAMGTSTAYTRSTTDPVLFVTGGSPQALQLNAAMSSASDNLAIPADTYNWANNTNATLMIVADCNSAELFSANSVNTTTKQISHAATANASASLSKTYGTDALVLPLASSLYFVATRTNASNPSLYRRYFNGSSVAVEELVPNVTAMTFQYGEDTTSPPDAVPDVYRTTAASVVSWPNVVTVRIGLILATEDDNLTPTTSGNINWLGGTYTPTDKRLRRAYSATVAVRNRMHL